MWRWATAGVIAIGLVSQNVRPEERHLLARDVAEGWSENRRITSAFRPTDVPRCPLPLGGTTLAIKRDC